MIVLGKGTAKPTERSFKGKGVGDFRGIVRFWKVMWSDGRCGNPSGSRPNFLGRQHLTFDKGGQGCWRFSRDSAKVKETTKIPRSFCGG